MASPSLKQTLVALSLAALKVLTPGSAKADGGVTFSPDLDNMRPNYTHFKIPGRLNTTTINNAEATAHCGYAVGKAVSGSRDEGLIRDPSLDFVVIKDPKNGLSLMAQEIYGAKVLFISDLKHKEMTAGVIYPDGRVKEFKGPDASYNGLPEPIRTQLTESNTSSIPVSAIMDFANLPYQACTGNFPAPDTTIGGFDKREAADKRALEKQLNGALATMLGIKVTGKGRAVMEEETGYGHRPRLNQRRDPRRERTFR